MVKRNNIPIVIFLVNKEYKYLNILYLYFTPLLQTPYSFRIVGFTYRFKLQTTNGEEFPRSPITGKLEQRTGN